MHVGLHSMLPFALLPANWLPYAALVLFVLPFGCLILPFHRLCCSSFGSQVTEHAEICTDRSGSVGLAQRCVLVHQFVPC